MTSGSGLPPAHGTEEQGIEELFIRIYNELGISADNQLSNTNSKPEAREAVRKRVLEAIKAKAEKGDAEAQLFLGISYLDSELGEFLGVKNWAEAEKWFRKAADQGSVLAKDALGNMLREWWPQLSEGPCGSNQVVSDGCRRGR